MNASNGNPYTLHTLDNGLRIIIEKMPDVRSAAAGFLVRTGARDEVPALAGVSHFLEHMMFKGTSKRDWRKITVDFDKMGSSYNAFTCEDRTAYYGWVRKKDIAIQIELLADMMRSTLPEDEFKMEKNVVLEEIAMSKDQLEHVAFDFLQEKVFKGHPLEWPVLGYEKTVQDLTRDQMWDYYQERYAPDNMMLIVTGNVDPSEIIDLATTHCASWKKAETKTPRQPPPICTGVDTLTVDRFNQQFVALTFPAVGGRDPREETAAAATIILGGDNSRFFWNIVQKGVSPRAGAHHLVYTDGGAMILYGACQPENSERLTDAMRVEADRICKEPVEAKEVERVKNKRRTGLAVESEAPYHRLTQLMDDMEYNDEPRTVDQMLADVDAVSVDSIRDYFEEFPINIEGHLTSVGPKSWDAET